MTEIGRIADSEYGITMAHDPPRPLPTPRYALDQQVRYTPYLPHPSWDTKDAPDPKRVVCIQVIHLLGSEPSVAYYIQPYLLTGSATLDGPIHVWEHQLTPWDSLVPGTNPFLEL